MQSTATLCSLRNTTSYISFIYIYWLCFIVKALPQEYFCILPRPVFSPIIIDPEFVTKSFTIRENSPMFDLF